jgi:hypothetical protein
MKIGVLHDGEVALTWEVGPAPLRVGRSEVNDLVLPHLDVSGHHAVLHAADGRIWVTDLRSANGTWVGGERIGAPTPLGPGERVRLGAHAVLVVLDAGVGDGALLLARDDGLAAWPIRGGLALPGADASLIVEPGAIWLAHGADDDQPLTVGEPFEVAGVRYVIRPVGAVATTARVEPSELALEVDLTGGRAVLEGREARCVFETDHRVALLHALGSRWLADGASPDGGWLSDADLAVAVWGRRHRDQAPNNLHVLVHRVRGEAVAAGLDRGFLQKRVGRTRVAVERVVVR